MVGRRPAHPFAGMDRKKGERSSLRLYLVQSFNFLRLPEWTIIRQHPLKVSLVSWEPNV